jgi:enediyne biosynthesis protein E4
MHIEGRTSAPPWRICPRRGTHSFMTAPRLGIVIAGALLGFAGANAPLFIESADAVGLRFTHVNGATGQYYMPEIMGAGGALLDYDGDGDLDVFLVQGSAIGDRGSGIGGRLFRSDLTVDAKGARALRFTDVTKDGAFRGHGYGMGAAVADYDNDGDLDIMVTAFGPDALYRNDGGGSFTAVTKETGVGDPFWSSSAAFIDFDCDGDLDLFVANYIDFTVAGNKQCADPTGARDYCGPRSYQPVPDRLYRNEGAGRFTDVSTVAGITRADGAGLGVSVGDYNGDGWLDLYVANDATPNQLWINQKNGTFVDNGPLSGTAVNAAGNPEGSMGIASGDYDADGDEDIFITNIIGETYALYENVASGSFEDRRVATGLARLTAAFTGFGTDWVDFDNDGLLDLFVANGAVNSLEGQRGKPTPFRMRNQLLRNLGGRRFADVSRQGGPAFEKLEVSRGAAFGDVDNDGDTDVLVTTNNGPVQLLLNQSGASAHWLQVRLEQGRANRWGLGARVGLERSGMPTLWRRVKTDGSYLSASDPRVQFGLGDSSRIDAVIVEWPDGGRERWTGLRVNSLVVLKHGEGASLPPARGEGQGEGACCLDPGLVTGMALSHAGTSSSRHVGNDTSASAENGTPRSTSPPRLMIAPAPTTVPPDSRATSIVSRVAPPVVTTSSTTSTRSPGSIEKPRRSVSRPSWRSAKMARTPRARATS